MPIPRKTIKIDLNRATPTELTPDVLQKQLNNIGLTCKYTDKKMLTKFISEVEATIPDGLIQTYQILKPAEKGEARLKGLVGEWAESSVGNWEPDSTALGYAADLEYLIYPQHFDWLRANRPSFTGTGDHENFKKRYDSVDSIKDAFTNLALTASSALIKGLNKDSIKSVFSNAISPLNDASARDYNKKDSRVVFLVENYDPKKKEADAIGVLAVDWHLIIKDYKEKKEALKHDTTLTVDARAVLYSDLNVMNADLAAAKAHFKGHAFGGKGGLLDGIPVKDTTVEIYDKRPPADDDTFRKSLPLVADSQKAQVLVLFSPDLQNIGSIDNTHSKATSSYAKSVTTGFTSSSTEKFDIGSEFEAGIVLAKGKLKVGFSISFTQQSSTATTETINFSVPPGEKAFTYQGTLRSQILEYDPATDLYLYKEESRFLTPIMATTEEPIASGAKAQIEH
ncbi:MAG: hypothetical protein KC592_12760 [Nitrospira sp.]|nr:hypothetical protein [Nitrospira sp.]